MKALSLTQPWASLVATDQKRVETRSWSTNYRGPLYIHAAKSMNDAAHDFATEELFGGRLPLVLPLGALIATARLVDVRRTEAVIRELTATEIRYGDYTPGRFAWFLEDIQELPEPIPARGALGLWEWTS